MYVSERVIPDSVFHISDEVSSAVHYGKPVVALESAIITHGLPYPVNIEYDVLLFGSKLGFSRILETLFDGVLAFGYNTAESEPIWMKSGAL